MVGQKYCFVPGCSTGYSSDRKRCKLEGRKVESLFSPPKDLLDIWQKKIPRADKVLTHYDKVCALHFRSRDIEKYYVTNLPDGSVHKLERSYPKLKKDAIPVFFPKPKLPKKRTKPSLHMKKWRIESSINSPHGSDNPLTVSEEQEENIVTYDDPISKIDNSENSPHNSSYSSFCVGEENQSIDSDDELIFNIVKSENSSHDSDNIKEEPNVKEYSSFGVERKTSLDVEVQNQNIAIYDDLISNLGNVELPSKLWAVTDTGSFTIFVKWNKVHSPERRIVIENDMKIKIFLHQIEIASEDRAIKCVDDMQGLILEVDRYIVCLGADDKLNTDCQGILQRRFRRGHSLYCDKCRYSRKQKLKALKNNVKKLISHRKKKTSRYQELVCAYRKNERLRAKVQLLQKKLAEQKPAKHYKVAKKINSVEKMTMSGTPETQLLSTAIVVKVQHSVSHIIWSLFVLLRNIL